jgi:hypothetical protein
MRLGHASASTAFDTEQEQASFAVPRMRVLGVCRTAQPQPCIEIRMYASTKLAHIAMCAKVRQHATFASFRLDSTSTPSPPSLARVHLPGFARRRPRRSGEISRPRPRYRAARTIHVGRPG